MGDLIERLRAFGADPYDFTECPLRADTFIEAADELASLRAEVEGLRAERTNILQSACEATERLRRMNEGMRQQHTTDSLTLRNLCSERDMQRQRAETAERERDDLWRRIAEAPTTHVRVERGGCWIDCDVPSEWADTQRVALVRLGPQP